MRERSIRVAIVGRTGAGNYGHQLDEGFARHPRSHVVALADPDQAGRAEAGRRTGAERTYADFREMLDRERADAVVVAPRHVDCHAEMVGAALERGRHVYCEKPLAQSLRQADAMVDAAGRAEVRLGNALPWIHEARARTVRDLLADGRIGRVRSMRGTCKCDHRGGGEDFLVLGLHFADMMRRIAGPALTSAALVTTAGRPVERADAVVGNEGIGPVAGDSIVATYGFADGVVGTLESWRLGIEDRGLQPYRLDVHGDEGILSIRAPYADHSLWLYPEPFVRPGGPSWERIPTEPVPTYGDYHLAAAADFFAAIDDGREPACSGADGRDALEMILAAYASHLEGRRIALPLVSRAHPLGDP